MAKHTHELYELELVSQNLLDRLIKNPLIKDSILIQQKKLNPELFLKEKRQVFGYQRPWGRGCPDGQSPSFQQWRPIDWASGSEPVRRMCSVRIMWQPGLRFNHNTLLACNPHGPTTGTHSLHKHRQPSTQI